MREDTTTPVIVSWLLLPFRTIADHPRVLLPLSVMLYLIAQAGMHRLMRPLFNYPPDGHRIPDMRVMGYSVTELNDYYDTLGVVGCRQYVEVENWDFFPFMPGYILLQGSLHVLAARQLRQSDRDALGVLLIFLLDAVESYWQRRGCVLYSSQPQHERLADWQIHLASACVRLKWTVLIVSGAQGLIKALQIYRQQRAWKARYHLPHFRRC